MYRMLTSLLFCLPLLAAAQVPAQIAADSQVLWLQPDGSVWASGDDGHVRGDRDSKPRNDFRRIDGLAQIVGIALNHDSSDSAAAIDADGGLWLWGDLVALACAKDDCEERHRPRRFDAMGAVRSVALGNDHVIAIGRDGKVRAAGRNDVGQLGQPVREGAWLEQGRVPQVVAGMDNAVAVAAQNDTSLILRADGTVWGMGSGGAGLLGKQGKWKPLDFNDPPHAQPLRIAGLENIKAISLGRFHALALDGAGQVWGWGLNDSAQLATPAVDIYPQLPRPLAGLDGAVAIAAGDDYSLVLKRDGSVWARGGNVYGTLGDGGDELVGDLRRIDALDGKNVVELFAGSYNAFARLADGSVLGWGRNAPTVGGFYAGGADDNLLPVALDVARQTPAPSAAVKAGAAEFVFTSELSEDQLDERSELWIDGKQAAVLQLDRKTPRSHRGQAVLELKPGIHTYELRGEMRTREAGTRKRAGKGAIVVTRRGVEDAFNAAMAQGGALGAYKQSLAAVRAVLPQLDASTELRSRPAPDTAALDAFEQKQGWKLPQAYRKALQEYGSFALGAAQGRYPAVALYPPEQFVTLDAWVEQGLARVPELDQGAALPTRDHDMLDSFRVFSSELAKVRERLAKDWQQDRLAALFPEAIYLVVPAHPQPCADARAHQRLVDFFQPEMNEETGEERYFAWADLAECELDLSGELRAAVFAHYTAALRASGVVFLRADRVGHERAELTPERLDDSGEGALKLRLSGGEPVAEY